MDKFNRFSSSKPGQGPARNNNSSRGKKNKNMNRHSSALRAPRPVNYEETGMEATYLKSLVDAETPIVVVLKTGEEVHGTVRYYDRDVFSLGPSNGGPKLFLRKESIRYLYEEA